MERFVDALATFDHAVERARQMVTLYDALSTLRKGDPANDDALRAAYFQAVSSFDFFAHELAAIEAVHRFRSGERTRNISLPMEIMAITDKNDRASAADAKIRQSNSYKSFVDPARLAEMLSCYCEKPWEIICLTVKTQREARGDPEDVSQIKGNLKSIWKRRNQIAHEADVNPALAGISLWPIDKPDTEFTISLIADIGDALPRVISTALTDDHDDLDDLF